MLTPLGRTPNWALHAAPPGSCSLPRVSIPALLTSAHACAQQGRSASAITARSIRDEYDVLLADGSCILADGAMKCNRAAKDMKAGAKYL
jgi:hypothetical protein